MQAKKDKHEEKKPKVAPKPTQDILKGVLIGLALGDALGAPHEFRSQRNNVYTGKLYIAPHYNFKWVKRTDVIGQYTDDTEMTLANIRSIVRQGQWVRNDIIESYEMWAHSSKAMGKNTRALFKGVTTVRGYESRFKKQFPNDDVKNEMQSNGCLMRCSFLTFLGNDVVQQDVNLTNPNPVCRQICAIYGALMQCVKFNKDQVRRWLIGIHSSPTTLPVISEAIKEAFIRNSTREVWINKGWIVHTFYCAVWVFLHFNKYYMAIDAVIKLGGDTDTNAAIAGALLGGRIGFRNLMKEDVTADNICIILNADFGEGDNPRPDIYLLKDVDDMIAKFHQILVPEKEEINEIEN